MKTFLVWGVQGELSEAVCQELARAERRLLLTGDNLEQLGLLDATLAQSELHRWCVSAAPTELADWVKQQRIGLDGLVLFPKAPNPARSALLPAAELQSVLEASVLAPLQVIRGLLAQLERGKKPKPLWIVLDWGAAEGPLGSVWGAILKQTWQTCVKQLAVEFGPKELVVNLLFPGPLQSERGEAEVTDAVRSLDYEDPVEVPSEEPSAARSLGVAAAARFAVRLFDDPAGALSGQLFELGSPR